MEVTRKRGRRRKKLLDDLKDRRGYSHLKEEALDRTVWRHRFGGGFGPVVRQNTEWMNEWICSLMWCWRRMEKISWTDHVRNEEVLLRVNEQRNILHEKSKRKTNGIGHILRRNCLLTGYWRKDKRGDRSDRKMKRRRRKLLDDLKERRG